MLGLLRRQVAVTIEGVDAFAAWAAGDTARRRLVRDAEHRGDTAKRELLTALRAAFVMPLEPEDVFALSRGIDWILNYARDLVNESEAMGCPPDAGNRGDGERCSARPCGTSTRRSQLGQSGDEATEAADAAIKPERGSSGRTTTAWRACSTSRTGASASRAASSTAAARVSARW